MRPLRAIAVSLAIVLLGGGCTTTGILRTADADAGARGELVIGRRTVFGIELPLGEWKPGIGIWINRERSVDTSIPVSGIGTGK
jgi:hypothetical protein